MPADATPPRPDPAEASLLTPATGMAQGSAELRAAGVADDVWQAGIVLDEVAGRGDVRRVALADGSVAVVRHYRRGGAIARWLGDRYWFSSAERTRCFAEYRLLEKLQRKGLPAPQPLAARYQRTGPWYRADLAMRELPDMRSLHRRLQEAAQALPTRLGAAVGDVIGRFHRAGVWHADLNAHNVLLDAEDDAWLVDFDRGEFRVPRRMWQQSNLHRLQRSLVKLGHAGQAEFDTVFWQPLLRAHAAAVAPEQGT